MRVLTGSVSDRFLLITIVKLYGARLTRIINSNLDKHTHVHIYRHDVQTRGPLSGWTEVKWAIVRWLRMVISSPSGTVYVVFVHV